MTTNDTRFNVININVGILGHVDSGKTTLTKAMSAIKSTASFDSSPQSVARGITLDLGFSGLFVPLTSITSSHVNGDHCDNEEVQIHTEERNEKEDSKLGSCGEIIQSPSKEKDKSEKSKSVIYTVPPDALEKYHRVLGNSYDIDTKYGNTASDATNTTGSNINSSSNDRTGVQLTFVDCPGHGSLIRTIIAGANIVDIMILVIDATKGVQAQTAECVAAGQALRKRIIVVINKCDKLIPQETVEEVRVRQELLGVWGRDPNNHILDDGETGDFIIDTDQSADLLAKLIGLYRKRLEAQSEAIRELKLMVNNFFRSGTAWTEGVPFVEVSAGGVSGDTEELLMNSNKAKDTPDLFMDSCADVHRVVERILCLVDPISLQQQRGVINNYNNSITHIPKYNKYGFILLADHCFSAGKGHNGAVVTGTVVCGSVEVGDSISIVDHSKVMMDAGVCGPVVSYTPVRAGMYDLLLPPNHSNSSLSTPVYITGLVVKSIQVFKQSVRTASMGDRCGICVSSSGNRSGSTSTNKGRIDVSAVERALIGGCKVIGAGFGLQVLLSDQSGGNDTAAMASQKCSNQTRVRELGKVSKRSADAMARIGILNTNVMYMVREAAELLLNRSFGGGASAAWNWPQAERYKAYINDNKNSKIFQKNQHSQDNDNIFIPISVTSYAALTAVGAAWCGNSNNEVSALYTLLVLSRESMISIGSTTTHKNTTRCICYTNNEINNNNNAHDVIDSPKPMQLSSAKETNSNNMSIPPYIPISLFLQRSAVVLNANCFIATVRRVPLFKTGDQSIINNNGRYHFTVGHTTVMGTMRFFSCPNPYLFNNNKSYSGVDNDCDVSIDDDKYKDKKSKKKSSKHEKTKKAKRHDSNNNDNTPDSNDELTISIDCRKDKHKKEKKDKNDKTKKMVEQQYQPSDNNILVDYLKVAKAFSTNTNTDVRNSKLKRETINSRYACSLSHIRDEAERSAMVEAEEASLLLGLFGTTIMHNNSSNLNEPLQHLLPKTAVFDYADRLEMDDYIDEDDGTCNAAIRVQSMDKCMSAYTATDSMRPNVGCDKSPIVSLSSSSHKEDNNNINNTSKEIMQGRETPSDAVHNKNAPSNRSPNKLSGTPIASHRRSVVYYAVVLLDTHVPLYAPSLGSMTDVSHNNSDELALLPTGANMFIASRLDMDYQQLKRSNNIDPTGASGTLMEESSGMACRLAVQGHVICALPDHHCSVARGIAAVAGDIPVGEEQGRSRFGKFISPTDITRTLGKCMTAMDSNIISSSVDVYTHATHNTVFPHIYASSNHITSTLYNDTNDVIPPYPTVIPILSDAPLHYSMYYNSSNTRRCNYSRAGCMSCTRATSADRIACARDYIHCMYLYLFSAFLLPRHLAPFFELLQINNNNVNNNIGLTPKETSSPNDRIVQATPEVSAAQGPIAMKIAAARAAAMGTTLLMDSNLHELPPSAGNMKSGKSVPPSHAPHDNDNIIVQRLAPVIFGYNSSISQGSKPIISDPNSLLDTLVLHHLVMGGWRSLPVIKAKEKIFPISVIGGIDASILCVNSSKGPALMPATEGFDPCLCLIEIPDKMDNNNNVRAREDSRPYIGMQVMCKVSERGDTEKKSKHRSKCHNKQNDKNRLSYNETYDTLTPNTNDNNNRIISGVVESTYGNNHIYLKVRFQYPIITPRTTSLPTEVILHIHRYPFGQVTSSGGW